MNDLLLILLAAFRPVINEPHVAVTIVMALVMVAVVAAVFAAAVGWTPRKR